MDVERPAVAGSTPKWILVADDDDAIRALWTAVLTRAGYRVLTACNGLEALDLMRAVVPDLIILDLRMPGMSGGAFLQAFDGGPVFEQIPVLIISGFLDEDTPRASLWLRIVGRLPKPLLPADLLAAVGAALADPDVPRVGKYPPGVHPPAYTTSRG